VLSLILFKNVETSSPRFLTNQNFWRGAFTPSSYATADGPAQRTQAAPKPSHKAGSPNIFVRGQPKLLHHSWRAEHKLLVQSKTILKHEYCSTTNVRLLKSGKITLILA